MRLTVALARQQRWRAAGQRERAEAHRENATKELDRADRLCDANRDRFSAPERPR